MYVAIGAMKPSKEQPPWPGSSEPTGEEHLGINLVSRWGAEGARNPRRKLDATARTAH